MKKPSNVKELCEFIWELEEKYNILDFEIEGVKPWQAHRQEIFFKLGKQFGIFEKELQRGLTPLQKIKALFSLIKNSILHNPLFGLKKVDSLIFSHPRSKKVDGKTIDIYSFYLIYDLLQEKKKFVEFEEHFKGKHLRKHVNYKKYLDFIVLLRNIKCIFFDISLTNEQSNRIKNIEEEMFSIIDLKGILLKRTKHFLSSYEIYKKILKKTMPKEIYVVVSYGRSELIKAAKDLNIKVIELQHGNFSKYHLGYSFPNRKKLDYFPDEFWVWNDYWKNLIEFPITKEYIKDYPFQYLERLKNRYNIKKKKKQLVILGQGGLTDRISKKILDNLEYFKHFNIIFKLHPEEYGRSELYKNLSKLQITLKINILEDIDLYQLLAESEYQAGVFSTALYEGVEFGCKTILFDLSGIEYMDRFIEMYEVKII